MADGLSGFLTGTGSLGGVTGTITCSFEMGTFVFTVGLSASFSEQLGPVSISGMIAAQGSSNGTANITLTNLMVSLGGGVINIVGGSAMLDDVGGKLSGTVSGMVTSNGIPGVSLSGNVMLAFTPSSLTVTGTNDTITVLGQTLSGNFTIADDGNGTVDVSVSDLSLMLANTVSITNGTADFTIGSSGAAKGIVGTGSGNVSVNLPGVSFGGAFGIAIDTTGGHSIFTVAANPMTITIAGQSLTGAFAFQTVTPSSGVATESLVASGINVTLGDSQTNVQISNAGGAILFLPTGVALDISGGVALNGITGLTLSGTVDVRVNTTGGAVDETVPAPDPNNPGMTIPQTLSFTGNENDVSGTATLAIGNGSGGQFVSLSGGFSFSQTESTVGSVTTTKLLIGAAGLNAFLGSGPGLLGDGSVNPAAIGVLIQNANLGLAVYSVVNGGMHTSTYALSAMGAVSLIGISGLTLSGTLGVESDTAGAVNETVNVPDPKNPGMTIPVPVVFAANTQGFSGTNVTLAVANPSNLTQQFVSLTGNFSFTQAVSGGTTTLSVAATNIAAFVGVGGTTPIGLQVADGTLGLVIIKTTGSASTYALAASGNVSLVGLPGLHVGGMLSVDVNTTGSQQTNPADAMNPIPVGATPVIKVQGLSFDIYDSSNTPVVALTMDATITKTGSVIDVDTTSAELKLNVNDTPVFDLIGSVDFTIGADGFKLGPNGFNISAFTILGTEVPTAIATSVAQPNVQANLPNVAPASSGASDASLPSLPTPTGTPRTLGPLSVYGLAPVFNSFSFNNGELEANVGLTATAATINSAGGTTAIIDNLTGTFQLAVGLDLSSFRITNFGPTGAFSLTAGAFVLNVPHVVNVSAKNIVINYDPHAASTQEILSIGSATVTVPIGSGGASGIQGSLNSITDSNGNVIPGLAVYGDHFQIGQATIKYVGDLSLGSVVKFTNPFVSITNFSASFSGSVSFTGSITIGAQSVTLGPSSFNVTGTDVAATLTQNNGSWGFSFSAGSVGFTLGPLNVSATNVGFDPTASGSAPLLSLSGLNVTLSLSSVTLNGFAGSNAGDIVISGNGSVSLPQNFSIGVTISAGTSGGLGWPSWIPIQIQSIILTWPDFSADSSNFTIDLSASVSGSIGPVQISGSVTDVIISVPKLLAGSFPIVGITAASISASGNVFGGTLSGTLILGVIKMDALNHRLPDNSTTFDHTIFYAGVEAGLMIGNDGFQIRFGLSQNGPLEAYIQIDAQILIVPPIDLAIDSLYGGITFDATPFPSITRATDLKSPVFSPGEQLTTAQWEIQLQQETVNQSGGGGGGYLFTDTSDSAGDAAGLDSGMITSNLRNTFLTNADLLSSGTSGDGSSIVVVPEAAGQEWLIIDGSNYYVVTRDLTNNLVISKDRFAIDSMASGANGTVGTVASLTSALNSGTVTPAMMAAFQAYGMALSSSATIQVTAPQPGQPVNTWTITDGMFKYLVMLDSHGVLNVESSGGSMDALSHPVRIEAAVTLGFEGTPPQEFSATGDIIIETDGKILLNVFANFGGGGGISQTFNFRMYTDLSQVASGDASTFFYFEKDNNFPGGIVDPEMIVAGGVTFGYVDAAGHMIVPGGPYANDAHAGFGISLNGEIVYSPFPLVQLTLTGEADIIFAPSKVTLTFDATLSASIADFIQVNNVVTAAGSFTIQYGGTFEIWGAAELYFDGGAIPFLQDAGIQTNAEFVLRINTDTDNSHDVMVNLPTPGGTPGQFTPIDFTLQPGSFGLYAVGTFTLDKGPVDFALDGVFDIDFIYNNGNFTFDIFAFAQLNLSIANVNLFTMNALGLLEINDNGVAAMLSISTSSDSSFLSFNSQFTLFLNTTGQQVVYTLPADLTGILGQLPVSNGTLLTAMETEFNNLSTMYPGYVSATGSGSNVMLSITIPAGLPAVQHDRGRQHSQRRRSVHGDCRQRHAGDSQHLQAARQLPDRRKLERRPDLRAGLAVSCFAGRYRRLRHAGHHQRRHRCRHHAGQRHQSRRHSQPCRRRHARGEQHGAGPNCQGIHVRLFQRHRQQHAG